MKPVPMPMPRPATEIWPSTKRSPPSMKRTMRSAMAPSATMPATPMAMPAMVKAYPRSVAEARHRLPFQADSTGRPRRRRTQVLMRASPNSSRSESADAATGTG